MSGCVVKTISRLGKATNKERLNAIDPSVFPTKDELRKHQLASLDVLIEFDSLCKKQGIKYYLFSGTLLGAIRHKGFIPWDDDIDVIAHREDYNRLLELRGKYFGRYHMEERPTDPTFLAFGEGLRDEDIRIDIFPLDALHGSLWKRRMFWFFMRAYGFIIGMKNEEQLPFEQFRIPGILLYYIIPLNGITLRKIYSRFMTLMDTDEEECLGLLRSPYDTLKHVTYEKRQFAKCVLVDFEGYKFPAPVDYHGVLSQLYGNYMELPPESQRYPHHYIDTSKYALIIKKGKIQ